MQQDSSRTSAAQETISITKRDGGHAHRSLSHEFAIITDRIACLQFTHLKDRGIDIGDLTDMFSKLGALDAAIKRKAWPRDVAAKIDAQRQPSAVSKARAAMRNFANGITKRF